MDIDAGTKRADGKIELSTRYSTSGSDMYFGMNQLSKELASLRFYAYALVLTLLTACSGGPPHQDPSWILVQITNVNMVVGEWEGIVKKEDAIFQEGSVRLKIRDNGTYLFVGQSPSKTALGAGSLDIRDGRLIGDTDRRAITFALYDHKGQSIIVVESANAETGDRYHGEFTQANNR